MTGRKHWLFISLYGIGIGTLAAAGIALAGATWFVDALPEKLLFDTFYSCLAVSLTALSLGCMGEVCLTVALTPDPKQLRAVSDANPALPPRPIRDPMADVRRAA